MKLFILLISIFLSFSFIPVYSESSKVEELIPKQFYLEGDDFYGDKEYEYDPYWKEYELFYRKNLDNDPELETIIQFVAIYDKSIPRSVILIIDNHKKYLLGLSQYPVERIDFYDLDKDGDLEMVFYSQSGTHYNDIYVYDYKDGLKKIFKDGTCGYIKFEIENNIPTIKICRPDYKRENMIEAVDNCFLNTYQWNGEEFEFNRELSTAERITEEEEFSEAENFTKEKIEEYLKNLDK